MRAQVVLSLSVIFLSLNADAKSFLVIGDSQSCGPFGELLVQKFKNSSLDRVTLVGHWGATAETWLEGGKKAPRLRTITTSGKSSLKTNIPAPTLSSMMAKTKPEAVIVQLGGNLVNQDPSRARSSVRQMMRKIVASGAECYWIGPSNGKRSQYEFFTLYRILYEVARDEHCRFIDSRPYTSYPEGRGDGLHYQFLGKEGERLAAKWVNGVWSELSAPLNLTSSLDSLRDYKVPADKTSVYQGVNQKRIYPAPAGANPHFLLESQGIGK